MDRLSFLAFAHCSGAHVASTTRTLSANIRQCSELRYVSGENITAAFEKRTRFGHVVAAGSEMFTAGKVMFRTANRARLSFVTLLSLGQKGPRVLQ